MKKLISFAVCLSMLSILITSCKKYDNGPTFSIYSKNARVDNTWKVEEILLNQSKVALTNQDKASSMVLRQDGQATWVLDAYVNESGMSYSATEITGKWKFGDKKKSIIFTQFGTSEYDILRLTNGEMWLKKMVGADVYEYHWVTKK